MAPPVPSLLPICVIPAADAGGLTGEASPLTLGQARDGRRAAAAAFSRDGAETAGAAEGPLAGAGMAARLMTQLPWKFTERSPGAVQTDPFEEEFFIGPSDNELDDGHVASLVRESVQNALDARVGSGPVRVRFALHAASVAATRAIYYRAGLKPHLAVLSPLVPWPMTSFSRGAAKTFIGFGEISAGARTAVKTPAAGGLARRSFLG